MYKLNEELRASLSEMMQGIVIENDHWIAHYPDGDNCEEYYHACCAKAVENLKNGFHADGKAPLDDDQKSDIADNEPHIDGGWSSEYEKIPHCASCNVKLTGVLMGSGITEELGHYESIEGA